MSTLIAGRLARPLRPLPSRPLRDLPWYLSLAAAWVAATGGLLVTAQVRLALGLV